MVDSPSEEAAGGREGPTEALTALVQAELELLHALGPRETGSPAHARLVDHVADELAEALGGAATVESDELVLDRWEVTPGSPVRLEVEGAAVDVAAPFPYSGTTGPDGAHGRLRLLRGPVPVWSLARGAIAVVPVSARPVPVARLVDVWPGSPPWPPTVHPLISATLAGMQLGRARRAGVRAVVFAWRDLPPAVAADQLVPFTLPYQDVPALFVAGAAAAAVTDAARRGSAGRLVLDARIHPGTTTRTVWAQVPGTERPDESLLVVTHSDGVNAVEENGHIALLHLARALREHSARRTVTLVLTSGHLRIPAVTRHGQATSRWLEDHPSAWAGGREGARSTDGTRARRALGGLGIEHLGAVELLPDDDGAHLAPTGRLEPELLYATTAELRDVVRREWDPPAGPARLSRPTPLIHFGEAEPLLQRGIPAVALVTAPQYLLARTGRTDLVDPARAAQQVLAFERVLRRMDALPADGFGRVAPAGAARRAGAAGALLLALARGPRAGAQSARIR